MQTARKKAFTLIELLVVITIILIILSMGMFALGGLSTPPLEESANTVESAMNIARQYAVSHGVPTYVVFYDYGSKQYGTPANPNIPGAWDKVTVLPMEMLKDESPESGKTLLQSPPTATLSYALDLVDPPLLDREMIQPVEFDYIPDAQVVQCLTDPAKPPAPQNLRCIIFEPDGTCDSVAPVTPEPVIPSDRTGAPGAPTNSIQLSNFVALYDDNMDERKYIYVYPHTCLPVINGD
ncbi:MAG: prepilin-type N-terminal cleavage/methylation domain-containing protein [Planctomycetota bacterium]